MPDEPQPQSAQEKRSFVITLARYSQLAFTLPAATAAGWILGALADKWLHTTWLYMLGLILGIVAGFVELIRTVLRSEKSEKP